MLRNNSSSSSSGSSSSSSKNRDDEPIQGPFFPLSVPMGTWKGLFKNYQQFGHAPSKRFPKNWPRKYFCNSVLSPTTAKPLSLVVDALF